MHEKQSGNATLRKSQKELTERQKEIILAFAEQNMNMFRTAKKIHRDRSSLAYHFKRIHKITGLDPRNFYDLIALVKIACK